MNQLQFEVSARDGGALVVTPRIDGRALPELVGDYERGRGYQPAGAYAGLVPEFFRYGPLDRYFMGAPDDLDGFWAGHGFYVLGCECGEVACWPLTCAIESGPQTVTWRDFGQDHRSTWDYADFGPFVFERIAYEQAVRDLARRCPAW